MSVYNSSFDVNRDDGEMTMMNHSFIYRPNDEPVGSEVLAARRFQQTDSTEEKTALPSYGPLDDLEETLNRYYQDLQQDSMSNVNRDQQLITRLFDLLIPAYSSNDQRVKHLEHFRDDIVDLQKKRFSQQNDQRDHLHAEIYELRSSIITRSIENREEAFQLKSLLQSDIRMNDTEWEEIDQETNELHQLIQTQNEQIKLLIEILSSKNQPESFPDYPVETASPPIEPVAPRIPTVDERFLCPYCNQQLPHEDELAYIEHLSQCFNEMNNIF